MRSGRLLVLLAALLATPHAVAEPPARPISHGSASNGALRDGFAMPLQGYGYRFYGPVRERRTNFATLELAALLGRVARVLARHAPGPALVIADCSVADGGPVRRHASHQSGRDVDLLFLARDEDGAPRDHARFVRFDGDGRCAQADCDLRFDDARNWWVVRTLAVSRDPAVQRIFVSTPIRERLLRYAAGQGEHPEILRRARSLLVQPGDSSPHDDHFHVRVYCPPKARGGTCRDFGPRWPWVRDGLAAPLGG